MSVRTPRAETIRWSLHDCSLGRSLIAGSEKGLCALLLGDDEEMLGKELRRRFRRAQLAPAEHEDARLADAVLAQIDAPGSPIDFPLDLRGSPFQKRVWAALRGIPLGKTASYAEIARAIGAPAATRAVAGACAANPIAVFIPCHRVLRSDGALSGYRWGVERKRELLAREGVQID